MNTIICEYCNKNFKTKSSLNNHKNKAKYCILKRKDQDKLKCNLCEKKLSSIKNLEIHKEKCDGKKKFKCEFCNKILSAKRNLDNHLICCAERKDLITKECDELNRLKELVELKDNEIKELLNLNEMKDKDLIEKDKIIIKLNTQNENYKEHFEKQEENYKEQLQKQEEKLSDLQNKLDKIANKAIDRPTTVVSNTTTNNNLNIMSSIDFNDLENIKYLIENKLNANHVVDGQKGIAQFLVDSFLKDDEGNLKYKCTDPSRSIFKYKNREGEINKDIEAKKLISYIVDGGIKGKSVEIAREWYTDEGVIDITKYKIMDQPQQLILSIEGENSGFRRELSSMTSV